MRVVPPRQITDAMLISSTVAETDHAAWNSATAYSEGDRVIRTQTHRIYERLVAGTTATAPESDSVNWLDVGPTNRWAMFDDQVSTSTSGSSPITVVLAPGTVNSLALLGLTSATQVTVGVTDGAGGPSVYSRTVPLDVTLIADWYEYFFSASTLLSEAVLTDLPPYSSARVTVSISGSAGLECGVLVVGNMQPLGDAQFGATAGITDYSRKETDEFGVAALVRRAYARRMTIRTTMPTAQIQRVYRLLAEIRATPCVWIGSLRTDLYGPLVMFGFYRDFSIDVAYPTMCACSLDIEGLI